MKTMYWPGAVLIVLFATIFSGCASTPKPDTELALAKENIERAKVRNAYQIAPKYINSAESKLNQAVAYIDQEEYEKATRLLKESNVDAEVALARIDEKRAKDSLQQLTASMSELEKEIKGQK